MHEQVYYCSTKYFFNNWSLVCLLLYNINLKKYYNECNENINVNIACLYAYN